MCEERDCRGPHSLVSEELGKLIERVREATGALMQGDARRYLGLINHALDYTLMPRPAARRGTDSRTLWCKR
jgi:hypothetical protein